MRKKLNNTRIVTRFLFLPLIIDKEWRWLEIAKIEQELVNRMDKEVWININWKN